MNDIVIDAEFKSLIPPLTKDEFEQLEKNCMGGIRDALVVWNDGAKNILIDGHNRYEIAKKHNLPFTTNEKSFESRDDAKLWIIDNQLGRRNLPVFDRVTLEDKKRNIFAKQANKKKVSNLKQNAPTEDKISCPRQPQTRLEKRENSTDYKIAKSAGTSEDTVRKVRAINESGDKELISHVRNNDVSINQAFRQVKGVDFEKPKRVNETKEAEQRHMSFEQSRKENKTIDFKDVMRDKDDVDTIAWQMFTDLQSGMNKITSVYRLGKIKVADGLKGIKTSDFQKQHFKEEVKACIKLLVNLDTRLEDW